MHRLSPKPMEVTPILDNLTENKHKWRIENSKDGIEVRFNKDKIKVTSMLEAIKWLQEKSV